MTIYVIQNLIQLDLIKMHHHEDHYLYSSINLYRTLWNVLHNKKNTYENDHYWKFYWYVRMYLEINMYVLSLLKYRFHLIC